MHLKSVWQTKYLLQNNTRIPNIFRQRSGVTKEPDIGKISFFLLFFFLSMWFGELKWVSEWVSDRCFKSQLIIFHSYRDWNKVYQAPWLGLWTKSCFLVVCMCWTRLALVRHAASLYSASPLKHHTTGTTGRQWYPNPDHYPDSEPASRSRNHLCWALSRAAEPQILTPFVLTRPGIESPTSRMPGERSTITLPGRNAKRNRMANSIESSKKIEQVKSSDFLRIYGQIYQILVMSGVDFCRAHSVERCLT